MRSVNLRVITLAHGSGGRVNSDLISNIFFKHFQNDILMQQNDSSLLQKLNCSKIAVTTDSFVIRPLFFPGGDIGKLSICGTINDLAVSGAKPVYLTAAFIIEEGLNIDTLEKIVVSMAQTAKKANVNIIAGDTKVVERGKGDKIYINTTGIGIIEDDNRILSANNIKGGDIVLVSGTLGDHGICVINEREDLGISVDIKSDCSLLNILTQDILEVSENIKFMRDPTRGGLATTLNEIAELGKISMVINEKDIPIRDEVIGMCELLGFDPLYVANEGKLVVIASRDDAEKVLEAMKKNPLGRDSKIIGEVIDDNRNNVYLKTKIQGTRLLTMGEGELLPRIC